MQRYADTIVDQYALPIVGASIEVQLFPSLTPATIYADDGVTQTANPLTTDSGGSFVFFTAPGNYRLVVNDSGYAQADQQIVLADVEALAAGRPQRIEASSYTTVMQDAGWSLYNPQAGGHGIAWTVADNANVPYTIGTELTFINDCVSPVRLTCASDTLEQEDTGATGDILLPRYGYARATKVSATKWQVSVTIRKNVTCDLRAFGAIGDGTSNPLSEFFGSLAAAQVFYPLAADLNEEIDYAAIMKAQAWIVSNSPTGCGTLEFWAAAFVSNKLIAQTPRVKFKGAGSRQTSLTYTGPSVLSTSTSRFITCKAGDGPTDYVFSTSCEGMTIDCNGLVNHGYSLRGWQEGCYTYDMVIAGFHGFGLELQAFSAINHQCEFSLLHLIASTASTTAIPLQAQDAQKCTFRNISSVNGSGSVMYDKGVHVLNSAYNTFDNIHTENSAYGVYLEGGTSNHFRNITALNIPGMSGIDAFHAVTADNYTIENLATISNGSVLGFVNHIHDDVHAELCIAATADIRSATIRRTNTSAERVSATSISTYREISIDETRGISKRGPIGPGQGVFTTYLQIGVAKAGESTSLIFDCGGATGFSGKITAFSRGDVRNCLEHLFSGAVDGSGLVIGPGISFASKTAGTDFVLFAPEALATPASGKFRLVCKNNNATYDAIIECEVEICTYSGAFNGLSQTAAAGVSVHAADVSTEVFENVDVAGQLALGGTVSGVIKAVGDLVYTPNSGVPPTFRGIFIDGGVGGGSGVHRASVPIYPVHGGGTQDVVFQVSNATGFSGVLKVFGTGGLRFFAEVYFTGYVDSDGNVSAGAVSGIAGISYAGNISISAPQALATPTANHFRITVTNPHASVDMVAEAAVELGLYGEYLTAYTHS